MSTAGTQVQDLPRPRGLSRCGSPQRLPLFSEPCSRWLSLLATAPPLPLWIQHRPNPRHSILLPRPPSPTRRRRLRLNSPLRRLPSRPLRRRLPSNPPPPQLPLPSDRSPKCPPSPPPLSKPWNNRMLPRWWTLPPPCRGVAKTRARGLAGRGQFRDTVSVDRSWRLPRELEFRTGRTLHQPYGNGRACVRFRGDGRSVEGWPDDVTYGSHLLVFSPRPPATQIWAVAIYFEGESIVRVQMGCQSTAVFFEFIKPNPTVLWWAP